MTCYQLGVKVAAAALSGAVAGEFNAPYTGGKPRINSLSDTPGTLAAVAGELGGNAWTPLEPAKGPAMAAERRAGDAHYASSIQNAGRAAVAQVTPTAPAKMLAGAANQPPEPQSQPNWQRYAQDADVYLKRFPGTPIKGSDLAAAASSAHKRTGRYVPLAVALAQLQRETRMGTTGRTNHAINPANVGEYDAKTTVVPRDLKDGLQRYYDLIANDYLRDKKPTQLITNFVNHAGKRYASDPNYEKYFKSQVPFIQRYIRERSGS